MLCPSKKALCVSCHAMLLCIQLNFQSGKGKVKNIGMFNKVRKLIVCENTVDGQCCSQQPLTLAIWKALFSI